jgi:Protein of unknown function (DUF3467)
MSDNPNQTTPPKQLSPKDFRIVEPRDGTAHVYANFSYLSWTGIDISVHLYELVQPNREVTGQEVQNTLLERAIVTFGWSAAKVFHKMLGEIIARYEKENGEIKTVFPPI